MKKLIALLIFTFLFQSAIAQTSDYQLSSHILDISKGIPASGVTIQLEKMNEKTNTWYIVEQKVTDSNGRITDFLKKSDANFGIYKLTYFTKAYFEKQKITSFYPFIEVVFEISD